MQYRSKQIQHEIENDFAARMELYLKCKSIYEYRVKRDLNGLNKHGLNLADEFVWWYIFKEKYCALLFWTVSAIAVACIGFPILLWTIGLSWTWALSIAIGSSLAVLSCFAIMNMTVTDLANAKVPSSTSKHSYKCFADVDAEVSSIKDDG